jgi:hypothetical protein
MDWGKAAPRAAFKLVFLKDSLDEYLILMPRYCQSRIHQIFNPRCGWQINYFMMGTISNHACFSSRLMFYHGLIYTVSEVQNTV